ncbi:hypothetical protein BS47DRAFT_1143632 [Hydnum rufescens UP504]|uniref:Uncharacterized protein n=1 Tax=Hydnum rufescens UP504 TaxID=1448309 RepID=A0A9P6DUH8_9AGAM|nr:hypothetical protein BS47DRAFT_1143632 [Hydnum rufescens UP504]
MRVRTISQRRRINSCSSPLTSSCGVGSGSLHSDLRWTTSSGVSMFCFITAIYLTKFSTIGLAMMWSPPNKVESSSPALYAAVSADMSSIELEAPTPSGDQCPVHHTIPLYRRSQWQISVSASCDGVLESSVHCAAHASISDRPSEDSTVVEQTWYSTSTCGGGSLEPEDHAFYSLFRITSPSEEETLRWAV